MAGVRGTAALIAAWAVLPFVSPLTVADVFMGAGDAFAALGTALWKADAAFARLYAPLGPGATFFGRGDSFKGLDDPFRFGKLRALCEVSILAWRGIGGVLDGSASLFEGLDALFDGLAGRFGGLGALFGGLADSVEGLDGCLDGANEVCAVLSLGSEVACSEVAFAAFRVDVSAVSVVGDAPPMARAFRCFAIDNGEH